MQHLVVHMVLEAYYDMRCTEEVYEVAVAVEVVVPATSSVVVDERENAWLIYAMTMRISAVVIVPLSRLIVV